MPDGIGTLFSDCAMSYGISNEDTGDYLENWKEVPPNYTESHKLNSPWRYRGFAELDGMPYAGTLSVYGGGGYVRDLIGTSKMAENSLEALSKTHWFDKYTRALFTEFTVYNPNTNLFSFVTLLLEQSSTNAIIHSAQVLTFRLHGYIGGFAIFVIISEAIFVLCTFYFMGSVYQRIRKEKCRKFLKSFWNLLDFVNIGLSITVMVLYGGRKVVTSYAMKKVVKLKGRCELKE